MVLLEEYLKKHPDAALVEYRDYCISLESEKQKQATQIELKYKEWIKEQDGKYFLVNFNNDSRVLFKLSLDTTYSGIRPKACLALDFYRSRDATYVKKEMKMMNVLWLNDLNPFYPDYKKVFNKWECSGNVSVVEVSQEIADTLFMQFRGTIDPFIDDLIQKEKTMLDTGTIVKS